MKPVAKSIALFALTFSITISFVLLNHRNPSPIQPDPMARSFVLWLHGLGDSGPANEPIKSFFNSSVFRNTNWSFPSAPSNPVTCNYGAVMPSWFDLHEIPVTATSARARPPHSIVRRAYFCIATCNFTTNKSKDSPKDEGGLLKAVQSVHTMIDKEIAAGTDPKNVFVCGFSQGGALTLASVLLYPKTLGGGAVFSGWVPLNTSILERVTPDAKKTPVLWSHGMADRTVLFEAGQAGPPFLEKAGFTCEFKAYPGLGHSISNEELRDLESWIKSRLQT